jgi:hypothetical protein
VQCGTALAGATLTTYPGESLLLSGSTASADPATHYDCTGPVSIWESSEGHVFTVRVPVDYCLRGPSAANRTYFARASVFAMISSDVLIFSPDRMDVVESSDRAVATRRVFQGSSASFYIYTCVDPEPDDPITSYCTFHDPQMQLGEGLDEHGEVFQALPDELSHKCVHVPVDWQMLVTMSATILHVLVTLGTLLYKAVRRVRRRRLAEAPLLTTP